MESERRCPRCHERLVPASKTFISKTYGPDCARCGAQLSYDTVGGVYLVSDEAPRTIVRAATPADIEQLNELLNHYVRHSNISFDEVEKSIDDRREWLESFASEGPFRLLVAVENGRIVGCAYSSRYRDHPAFRETVETSIYLAPDARRRGVGSTLYAALFDVLRTERVHRAVVGIALPNAASVALHERFGFVTVGVFDEYAIKRGARISSVWMWKAVQTQ